MLNGMLKVKAKGFVNVFITTGQRSQHGEHGNVILTTCSASAGLYLECSCPSGPDTENDFSAPSTWQSIIGPCSGFGQNGRPSFRMASPCRDSESSVLSLSS